MRLTILCLYPVIFLSLKAQTDMKPDFTEFCRKNPSAYYCEPDLPTIIAPACGTQISGISFPPFDYVAFIRDINLRRKDMAQGNAVVNGAKFPTVGDMIEMRWSKELETAAENAVRHCFKSSSPEQAKRVVPSIPAKEIGSLVNYMDISPGANPFDIWTNYINGLVENELAQLANYAAKKGELKDPGLNVTVYSKQRYIGCGNLMFNDAATDTPDKIFILCFLSPANLSTSILFNLGEKPCSACQAKTECSTVGEFKGILCDWTGIGTKLSSCLTLISTLLAFVLYRN